MHYVLRVLCALFVGLCVINARSVDSDEFFSRSNMKFAANMYNALAAGAPRENFVFSPFSIQTSAAMLYTGAAGQTAEELAKGLKLATNDRNKVANSFQTALKSHKNEQLDIANKIYIAKDTTVDPEFHRLVTEKFNSSEENIDFTDKEKAKDTINNWVKDVTHDKITEIVKSSSFSDKTMLMLLNAIYFKGAWVYPFPPTFKGDFWTINEEEKEVDYMSTLDEFKVGDFPELEAKVLQMDYIYSNISMLILLPNARNGLKDLEQKLQNIDLLEISTQLKPADYVDVALPKFKIEYSINLQEPFEKLGMGQIFSDNADFSNMVQVPAKIGKALHKTVIDVNEHGTEAAGVTVLDIRPKTIFPRFYALHPFIFAIKSNNAILFLGRFVA